MTEGFRGRQWAGVIILTRIWRDFGIGDGAGRMARALRRWGIGNRPGPTDCSIRPQTVEQKAATGSARVDCEAGSGAKWVRARELWCGSRVFLNQQLDRVGLALQRRRMWVGAKCQNLKQRRRDCSNRVNARRRRFTLPVKRPIKWRSHSGPDYTRRMRAGSPVRATPP